MQIKSIVITPPILFICLRTHIIIKCYNLRRLINYFLLLSTSSSNYYTMACRTNVLHNMGLRSIENYWMLLEII